MKAQNGAIMQEMIFGEIISAYLFFTREYNQPTNKKERVKDIDNSTFHGCPLTDDGAGK